MLYLQIESPKSSVLNFLDSNSFEVIISIFQRTEKVPDMERLHLGKVMCKFAETFAPQASELCRGQYYQPKEPDNMKLFVAKCQGKNV